MILGDNIVLLLLLSIHVLESSICELLVLMLVLSSLFIDDTFRVAPRVSLPLSHYIIGVYCNSCALGSIYINTPQQNPLMQPNQPAARYLLHQKKKNHMTGHLSPLRLNTVVILMLMLLLFYALPEDYNSSISLILMIR